jgi:tripartite-type tricarboxylate transporter receptor subunit TctC|tara:strand:- start:1255 stop:2235 length:981 start_codon:yes stop_codon:yes gene_type:complete
MLKRLSGEKIMNIKSIFAGICATLAILAAPAVQAAEWKPSGPVTLTIGFGPGGSTDTMGRLIAAHIEKTKGWTMVVKNRGGGSGTVMLKALMRQKPDGLNVGMAVSLGPIIDVATRKTTPFKLDSFDYLATVTSGHLVLIAKGDTPYNDIAGLVAFAKKKGGVPVTSNGRSGNLILRVISKKAGVDLRAVPTKGGAESVKQVLGGHVAAGFDGGRHMKYLPTGDLKVLATMSKNRHPMAKDQPTLQEQGYPYPVEPTWFAAAPAGLPANVKAALAAAFNDAIYSADVRKIVEKRFRLKVNNLGPEGTTKLFNTGFDDLKSLVEAAK